MPKYEALSPELERRMQTEKANRTYPKIAFDDSMVLRRYEDPADATTIWRPNFAHDIDRIMHCPYYNRYTDKTQVYSLVKNDDVTRRSLHVQLVSRIARTIGRALHLNLDLIEAIALGHDIGHPPFAHTGEKYLNELYFQYAGRYFNHNIHSVRVLDGIFPFNISLQVLDGIAGHNGEFELEECHPVPLRDFAEFDQRIEQCYTERGGANKIQPSTLEGAVVRVSDIVAYLGTDRQDAQRINMVSPGAFIDSALGSINAEIINNLVVNIIENSYGKNFIKLDSSHFKALQEGKRANYRLIYESGSLRSQMDHTIRPMMGEIYGQLLEDLRLGKTYSPIFTHHIDYIKQTHYKRTVPYEKTEHNQMVVDYIASMTDDYFVDLHHFLFPDSDLAVEYRGYFDGEVYEHV